MIQSRPWDASGLFIADRRSRTHGNTQLPRSAPGTRLVGSFAGDCGIKGEPEATQGWTERGHRFTRSSRPLFLACEGSIPGGILRVQREATAVSVLLDFLRLSILALEVSNRDVQQLPLGDSSCHLGEFTVLENQKRIVSPTMAGDKSPIEAIGYPLALGPQNAENCC